MTTTTVYDFTVTTLDGQVWSWEACRGRVLLIANTASRCGFTPQYTGLEQLWRQYRDQGLTVIGFPCNQFGAQEPGDADEIASFCETRYDVTFPMMAKVDVNGDLADPLFEWLCREAPGILGTRAVKWNFTKFLIDRHGHVLRRYAPTDAPSALAADIEAALAAG
jgi:glutathione peroxidase